jgi:hypothetical protein
MTCPAPSVSAVNRDQKIPFAVDTLRLEGDANGSAHGRRADGGA